MSLTARRRSCTAVMTVVLLAATPLPLLACAEASGHTICPSASSRAGLSAGGCHDAQPAAPRVACDCGGEHGAIPPPAEEARSTQADALPAAHRSVEIVPVPGRDGPTEHTRPIPPSRPLFALFSAFLI